MKLKSKAQYLNYMISLCDLQYRKNCSAEALVTARKCLKEAENVHTVVFHRAMCRVVTLSKLL